MVGRWRAAGDVINVVREAQATSGKLAGGSSHIADDVLKRITSFVRSDHIFRELLVAEPKMREAARTLLERFEEIARRRKVTFKPKHHVRVYRTILCHLFADATLLEMSPKAVGPATLANRESVGRIPDEPEFQTLQETPGAVRTAVVGTPADPREFLRKILQAEREALSWFSSLTFLMS